MQGNTFIVTGAGGGIGKVIALEFLRAGASVVITGRNPERLESARHEFVNMGFTPFAVPADLSISPECVHLVRSAVDHFGKIDGLINNAGLPARGRFENSDAGLFSMVVTGNLLTAVNCTKAALPELFKSRGSLVFISSIAAIRGLPNAAAYSAAKSGLEKFAESLQVEMHAHGVHVGILRPGLVSPPPGKTVLRDDGTFKPVFHKGHQSQESVARAVLRMVSGRKRRMTMTPAGKLLVILNWLAPWLVRFIFRKTQYSRKYEVQKQV